MLMTGSNNSKTAWLLTTSYNYTKTGVNKVQVNYACLFALVDTVSNSAQFKNVRTETASYVLYHKIFSSESFDE